MLGVTYNFKNPDTDYRSGVDGHLDWAASQFVSEHVHLDAARPLPVPLVPSVVAGDPPARGGAGV